MHDMFKDNIDVDWSCVDFQGIPMLVVQTTGPILSSRMLSIEFTDLQTRFILDEAQLPEVVPQTFIVYNGTDVASPLLVCDIEPMLLPLIAALEVGEPWFLCLQFLVEGERYARIFQVRGAQATPISGPNAETVLSRWVVGIE